MRLTQTRPPLSEDGEEYTATGRRKRKDAGTKREKGSLRQWTEEEEAKYQEGLRVHGRDWRAIAALVGTRDHRAIASHAQKHFIRLCLQASPAAFGYIPGWLVG